MAKMAAAPVANAIADDSCKCSTGFRDAVVSGFGVEISVISKQIINK